MTSAYAAGTQKRTALLAFLGIAVLALAARIFGITYGLPYLFYHHDEPQIVLRALRFGTGDFNPHIFWWPGTFQMDLMFVVYAVMFVAERLGGLVASSQAFAASYFRDPTFFYLSGRLVTLAFGLATVYLTFRLGKRSHSSAAGAIAAFYLSINPMHVEWSRLVLPVVPMTFWVVLAFLAALKIAEEASIRWYLLSGIAAGLATACLYYGALVALAIPLAHGLRLRRQGGGLARIVLDPRPYAAFAAMVAAFIAVCPYAVLDWRGFRQDIVSTYFGYARWETGGKGGLARYLAACVVALARSLNRAVGAPVTIAALAGLVLSLRKRASKSTLMAAFVIIYLGVLGLSSGHRGRHMAPVVPMLAVFAASLTVKASELASPRVSRTLGLIGIPIIIGLSSMWQIARLDSELMHEDTRVEAKRWVEATIPAGSKIVLDASSYRNTATAPLEETDQDIEQRLADLASGKAHGYGYMPAYTKYYQMVLRYRQRGEKQYDQWWTEFGTNVRPLQWFRENGYQYAMVSSIVTERYYDESFSERFAKSTPFYRELDSLAVLVKTFEPRPWTKPGPTLKLYRIQ